MQKTIKYLFIRREYSMKFYDKDGKLYDNKSEAVAANVKRSLEKIKSKFSRKNGYSNVIEITEADIKAFEENEQS